MEKVLAKSGNGNPLALAKLKHIHKKTSISQYGTHTLQPLPARIMII